MLQSASDRQCLLWTLLANNQDGHLFVRFVIWFLSMKTHIIIFHFASFDPELYLVSGFRVGVTLLTLTFGLDKAIIDKNTCVVLLKPAATGPFTDATAVAVNLCFERRNTEHTSLVGFFTI